MNSSPSMRPGACSPRPIAASWRASPRAHPPEVPTMARIELVELAHSYKPAPKVESDYALRPLNMSWRDGGAYALLGPSGCGKTTLLNVMSGLLHPSHGRVLFDGRDVTTL